MATGVEPRSLPFMQMLLDTPESCRRHHSTESSFLPRPRPRPRPHQLGLPEAVQGTLLHHVPGGPARRPGISRPQLEVGAGPSLPLTRRM